MKRERVEEILKGFTGCRLIVLGDLMLDEFIWGEVRRISPEAPVPVVEVSSSTTTRLPSRSGPSTCLPRP